MHQILNKMKNALLVTTGALLIFNPAVSHAAKSAAVVSEPLSIEASYNRQAFSPERGDSVAIRYTVNKPAELTLIIEGPDGREWYKDKKSVKSPGRGEFYWKGQDSNGTNVPSEAYRFHVTAVSKTEKTVANSMGYLDGMTVQAAQISLDRTTGEIHYLLRKPARVRVLAKLARSGVPLGTIEDWNARPAGLHTAHIDMKYFTQLFGEQDITPIIQAWSLPAKSLIVLPKNGKPQREAFLNYDAKPAMPEKPWYTDANGLNIEQHATHPYSQCYDPKVTLTPLEALAEKDGAWVIEKTTTIRIDVPKAQGKGLRDPIPRYSLFLYVDDKVVTRILPAYLPFQLQIDPAKFAAGDHVITAMLSWRDDHIGVMHQKIHIPQAAKKYK